MPTLKEITILVLAALIDLASTTPTAAVNYTLYGIMKTWNEARDVCESHGQQMLKLDTEAKLLNFMVWKNIWIGNGLITGDVWTGLHQHVLTDPNVFNLEWHDCEPLGAWVPWYPLEPNRPDSEKCIRIPYDSNQFRTTACHLYRHLVCQEPADECTFERFDDQAVALLTSVASINGCFDDCQRACLTHTGSGQCVAIVYDSKTTSGDPCRIYTRQQVYINEQPEMTSSPGRTVLVKRCVQGSYMSTAVSVPTNTDNDPITACPVTTETSTSTMTPEPISVLSTCPGATVDGQISILSNTQSKTIYSSYASISEDDLEYQSVSTSANISPERNSVAISITSSSVKTSVIETESVESHLTSTMTSHNLTPISLYSSTSSGGFRDSTSHNLYWSIGHLTSVADSTTTKTVSASNVAPDSTTTKTVSASNVVPSETLTMTMSESSQITTLLGAVDTSSEGTQSTSTIVIDPLEPESSILVSNLNRDPSSVALDTGSRSPRERHLVCACMHPLMSMTVDVGGNILDRKKISSYRRSKTSASDDRVSARTIGASGLAIILIVTVPIVCIDVDRMIRATRRCRKRQAL